jgi:hypothetical protein
MQTLHNTNTNEHWSALSTALLSKTGAGISPGTLEKAMVLPPPAAAPSPAPIAIGAITVAVYPRTVITAAPIAIGAIAVAVYSRTVIAAAPSPVPPTGLFYESVSLPVNGLLS